MDKLVAMNAFLRVAELESFTKAAESMGLPKASISTYVQHLESQLGTRLLNRTTRRVQLTQDGQIFYERCVDLLSDMDEVESMFKHNPANLTGKLRVDMPNGFARNSFMPHLAEFSAKHPHLEFEISSTDRKVDVIREGFDCVVRVGHMSDSGLIVRRVGEMKIINCVSKTYIEKFGRPKTIEDLAKHYLVHYVPNLGSKSDGFEYFDGERYKSIKMRGQITVNNSDAYTNACLAGFGIIQAPVMGMREHIKRGDVVEVLPKLVAEPMPVSLVYPHRRHVALRVQVFMDWMQGLLQQYIR